MSGITNYRKRVSPSVHCLMTCNGCCFLFRGQVILNFAHTLVLVFNFLTQRIVQACCLATLRPFQEIAVRDFLKKSERRNGPYLSSIGDSVGNHSQYLANSTNNNYLRPDRGDQSVSHNKMAVAK